MATSEDGFLGLPARPGKPRETGLTHVIDKGLNLREIEGLFDTAGAYVDIVKLGWGTGYVTNNLEKKIALYRSFELPVVCGGTLFEAVYARGKLAEFKRWLSGYRFSHVEISDGTVEIPRERKLELIEEFARDFTVLSEVGSKDENVNIAPYLWVRWMREELEAGAWRVIAEGRESGNAGIYRPSGELRTGLVDEIEHSIAVREPDLGGADEGEPGLVREALRPERQPRQHPARRGDPPRDPAPGAARRHAEGGAPCQPIATPSPVAPSHPDLEALSAEEVVRWAYDEFPRSSRSRARGRSSPRCSCTWSRSSGSTSP